MESFIVRLWSPPEQDAPALRGTALHVASGVAVTFSDPAELIAFLATSGAQPLRRTHGPRLLEP